MNKETVFTISLTLFILFISFLLSPQVYANKELAGRILLQVESNGEGWYISPKDNKRYYLGRPKDAFSLMRQEGLGISNLDLNKIPMSLEGNENLPDSDGDGLSNLFENFYGTNPNEIDTDKDGFADLIEITSGYNPRGSGKLYDDKLISRVKGQILLQVEDKGQAWWVNPDNNTRYYLGKPRDAFELMKRFGIGITNNNIEKISVSERSAPVIKNEAPVVTQAPAVQRTEPVTPQENNQRNNTDEENRIAENPQGASIQNNVTPTPEPIIVNPPTVTSPIPRAPAPTPLPTPAPAPTPTPEPVTPAPQPETTPEPESAPPSSLTPTPEPEGEDNESLPLVNLSNIKYHGAFRLIADTFNDSSLNYAEGAFDYNPDNNSIFIVGHSREQKIAEFPVPEIVNSTNVSDLNISDSPIQEFQPVLDQGTTGNPQGLDRITGIEYINTGSSKKLIVNGIEYYDANTDVTHTTLVFDNPNDLENSTVQGYFEFPDRAHAAGWISPIPTHWQAELGGTYITGHSSGKPIISRHSVGPSAFSFNPIEDLLSVTETPYTIPTTKLLDYSLQTPLNEDLANDSRTNDLWTHISRANYGFIAPNTKTYITFGFSAGHQTGIQYKKTEDGRQCGGYCANYAEDYYQYYWLFNVEDLIKVKNGEINSYDVMPYERGIFPGAFPVNEIIGGSYDPESERLFISFGKAETEQGRYSNPPIIGVYKIELD